MGACNEVVEQASRVKWWSRRVAFSHPPRLLLTGGADSGGINMQRLVDLEVAVGTQPEFSQVKLAAKVMIKAAKQLVAGGRVALLEDSE